MKCITNFLEKLYYSKILAMKIMSIMKFSPRINIAKNIFYTLIFEKLFLIRELRVKCMNLYGVFLSCTFS